MSNIISKSRRSAEGESLQYWCASQRCAPRAADKQRSGQGGHAAEPRQRPCGKTEVFCSGITCEAHMLRGASCRPVPARLRQSCPAVLRAPVRNMVSLSRRPAQPVPRDRDASFAPALQPSAPRYSARMQKSSTPNIWPLNRCYSTAPESTPASASPKHRGRSAWGLLLALIVGALFVLYLWRESRRLRKGADIAG